MMSRLKVSKALASSTAARAWSPLCTRPMALRKRSSKLCTPIDRRLMPAWRKARKRSFSKVPGLASMVISQSGSMRRRARRPLISWSMDSGLNRLGVPPPMNTLCTVRPQISGRLASRSAISASI
jgi:hypothetical protein